MPGSRGPASRMWACWAVPAIVAVVLLWPVVARPSAWIWSPQAEHSDLAVSHWPNALFTRRTVWEEGRFPTWRPTVMSGAPFAANPLSGLCYPPNWLVLFATWLPLEIGFNISALAHLWLAGVAMCALLRAVFRCNTWGALAGAVAFEASPKLIGHLVAGHVGWSQAMAWLPLVVLCWMKALRLTADAGHREGSWRWGVAAGAAAAMQFCADTRASAYSLAAIGVLTLVWGLERLRGRAGEPGRSEARRAARRLARRWLAPAAAGLGTLVALTACQWLPLLALLPHLTRSSMAVEDAAVWSLPWRYLAGLFIADHSGFHEWMTYLGVSTLVLASIGAWRLWRERQERWLFWWLLLIVGGGIWFSLGEEGGLFSLLGKVMPGLVLLRVPPRAWALVTFGGAVLAGLGLDNLTARASAVPRLGRAGRLALLAVSAFALLLLIGYWATVGQPQPAVLAFGLVTPLTAGLCLAARKSSSRPWVCPALVCLVALDLGLVDSTLVGARPQPEVFAEGRAAAEWLSAQGNEFRVYSPSYSLPQHVAELYRLQLADGVDPIQLQVYADYLTEAAGAQRSGYSVTLPPFPEGADPRIALQNVVPDAGMLGLLGVRYAASAFPINGSDWRPVAELDGVYVYENGLYQPVPKPDRPGKIVLADGTVLFDYDATPVYLGWTVSVLAVVVLAVVWILDRAVGGRDRA
jgi:hypothetical protein